jgi:selenocysteine-specific elongation factor
VKFFVGASESIATLRILGVEELSPDEEGWIQLELLEPVVAVRGDRYILRRPSPSETLGGGVIIDHQPKGRHKRFDEEVIRSLESLAQGSPSDILLEAAMATNIASIKEIVTRSRLETIPANEALKELMESGKLVFLEEGSPAPSSDALVIALPQWNMLRDKTMQFIESYHKDFPLRRGIPREELKSKLKLASRVFNAIINKLITDHLLADYSSSITKPGHTIRFNEREQAKIQTLMRKFEGNPFGPPSVKDCQSEVGEDVLNALLETNELIAVSSDVVFRKGDYDLMVSKIRNMIVQSGKISLAEVRDTFNTSRKYAQALLEHLDLTGITARDGDFRMLKKQ